MLDVDLMWMLNEDEKQQYYDQMSQAREKAKCKHEQSAEILLVITSTGQKRYYKMCPMCGETKAIAKSKLPPAVIRNAQPKDEERRKKLRENEYERRNFAAAIQAEHWKIIAETRLQNRRIKYSNYLLSKQWKEKRKMIFDRCNGICEGCGKDKATEVHHVTYDRIFNEMLFDLVGVCKACHDIIHSG